MKSHDMRKIIAIIAIAGTLQSCGMYSLYTGEYKLSLNKVSSNDSVGMSTNNDLSYSDQYIDIKWNPGSSNIGFKLVNKSQQIIKIMWDDVVFIDIDGSSNHVMHTGIKYSDRENHQSPSVIAKNSFVDDMVLPTKNVYYETNPYIAGWKERFYLPIKNVNKDVLEKTATSYIGKSIKIMMPIMVASEIHNYEFSFNIKSFTTIN